MIVGTSVPAFVLIHRMKTTRSRNQSLHPNEEPAECLLKLIPQPTSMCLHCPQNVMSPLPLPSKRHVGKHQSHGLSGIDPQKSLTKNSPWAVSTIQASRRFHRVHEELACNKCQPCVGVFEDARRKTI